LISFLVMPWIYHEKQDAGLCGVHCLNNLLQGRFVTELDLMTYARRLDEAERHIMGEMGTETSDYLKFIAEDSGNVADDGNYSIQVLCEALKELGLTCTPTTAPQESHVLDNPQKEKAFICNLASHWLTIRKIDGEWWNLNSLLKEPQHLTELYLGAFLKQLQVEGYSIFVVRGNIPEGPVLDQEDMKDVHWIEPPRRQSLTHSEDDEDLQEAIALSLQKEKNTAENVSTSEKNPIVIDDDDEDIKLAISLSQVPPTPPQTRQSQPQSQSQQPQSQSQQPQSQQSQQPQSQQSQQPQSQQSQQPQSQSQQPQSQQSQQPQAHPQLRVLSSNSSEGSATQALRLSPEPSGSENKRDLTKLIVRLPDGTRIERKFLKSDKLQSVFDWILTVTNQTVNLYHPQSFKLMTTFPKREFTNPTTTLDELGLCPSATLVVYDIK
jgi:ataxin-3